MILRADARTIPLRDEVVQVAITSPPYWGLRDYGTGHWEGGVPFCNHLDGYKKGRSDYAVQTGDGGLAARKAGATKSGFGSRTTCSCGAKWEDPAIGLEDSLERYLEEIVTVFREVRRVLRKDGLLFLNIGDTYSGSGRGEGGGRNPETSSKQLTNKGSVFLHRTPKISGIKSHQLLGIPWQIAFALQSDGWYLRSDIIWHKPNPMPESLSVRRCTVSHEYLFMLSKSGMDYYWDGKAIEEPVVEDRHSIGTGYKRTRGKTFLSMGGEEICLDDKWNMKIGEANSISKHTGPVLGPSIKGSQSWAQYTLGAGKGPEWRNRRDVWSITVEHSPESHYATFPQALVLPCILAGSRVGDLVYDPFGGTSTVGYVAERLGRRWVTTELSMDYCKAAQRRTAQMGLFQ